MDNGFQRALLLVVTVFIVISFISGESNGANGNGLIIPLPGIKS